MFVNISQLDPNLDIPGKNESQLRIVSTRLSVGMFVEYFLNDRCGSAHPTVGGATPGQMVPDCGRKQADRKPSSVPLWPLPLDHFGLP